LAALIVPLAMLPAGFRRGRNKLLWSTACLLFLFTGLNIGLKELVSGEDFVAPRNVGPIHATVIKTLKSDPESRVLLVGSGMNAAGRVPLPGRGRLSVRGNPIPLCFGDRIAFRARLRKPRNRCNPGEYDWEMYCKNNGILWQASVRGNGSILLTRRGSPYRPRAIMCRIRQAMGGFLDRHSTGDVRAVLKGIVVGDRGEIDPGLRKSFADSGLAHMLSASGLHVGIVALLTLLFAKGIARAVPRILLHYPLRKIAAAASVPAMLTYCWIVGARVPAIRATTMGLVVAAALLLDRRWHSVNSLALAGLIILLVYPLSIFTAGFQLSFAAVVGILLVVPKLLSGLYDPHAFGGAGAPATWQTDLFQRLKDGVRHWSRHMTAFVLVTLAATVAVSPFLVRIFHSFPLYSPAANVLAWPLLALALPTALIAAAVGAVAPNVGALILAPAAGIVHALVGVATFFSSLPGSTLRFPHPGNLEFVFGIILAFSFLWLMREPTRRRLLLVSAGALILAGISLIAARQALYDGKLHAVFLNVGKADAAFVKPPGAEGLLIDGGPRNRYFDAGTSILIPFFEWKGIRSLAGIVISHPQMDHLGGLMSVIPRAPPIRLWWNPIDYEPPVLTETLVTARDCDARLEVADRTCPPIRLGGATMRFLNSRGGKIRKNRAFRNVNNASVVLRIDYGRVSFLFTGDLEKSGEEELLHAGVPLRATVLKVAHHGCGSSTSRRFLQAVRPRLAVISCNDYRHAKCPDRRVLDRLRDVGADILWTGRDGAVTIETDGKDLKVKTARDNRDRFYSLSD